MSFNNYLTKFSLFIISTEVKLALILNQAESHLIKPPTSAQHIAVGESLNKAGDTNVSLVQVSGMCHELVNECLANPAYV